MSSDNSASRTRAMPVWQMLCVIALIAALTVLAWSEALKGYFLLDDAWFVPLVYRALHGEPDLIWRQFFGEYCLRHSIFSFYRPLAIIYYLIDFLIWGNNAFGFHLTNLILHALAALFVFATVRSVLALFTTEEDTSPRTAGLFAIPLLVSVIFTVYPGQSEAVCWITDRTDSVTACFYLAALLCGIKWYEDNFKTWRMCCLVGFFVLGLMTRETFVTLPFVLITILATKQSGVLAASNKIAVGLRSFKQAGLALVKRLWPLWVLLPVYILVRTAALGTLIGGYTGTTAACLRDSLFSRLFSFDTILTFLHPINSYLVSIDSIWNMQYNVVYISAAVLVLVNYFNAPCFMRRLKIAGVSFVLTLIMVAPTLQIWYATEGLAGLRLAYIAMSFTVLAVILMLYPLDESSNKSNQRITNLLRLACIAVVTIFTGVSIFLSSQIAKAYTEVSLETNVIRKELFDAVAGLDPGKKLVVFNLPKARYGITVFDSSDFLRGFLSPPLSESEAWKRLIALDGDPINTEFMRFSLLKELVANAEREQAGYQFFTWNSAERKLDQVVFPESTAAELSPLRIEPIGTFGAVRVENGKNLQLIYSNRMPGQFYRSFILKGSGPISPFQSQLLELKIVVRPKKHRNWWQNFVDSLPFNHDKMWQTVDAASGRKTLHNGPDLVLTWTSQTYASDENALPVVLRTVESEEAVTYRLNMTEFKRWLMAGRVDDLRIDLPENGYDYELQSARWVDPDTYIPSLSFTGKGELNNSGAIEVDKDARLSFRYNARAVPAATQAMVEVSQPYCQFSILAHTLRGLKPSTVTHELIKLEAPAGEFELPYRIVANPAAYYEVRVCGINADGKVVGSFSDPVTISTFKDP